MHDYDQALLSRQPLWKQLHDYIIPGKTFQRRALPHNVSFHSFYLLHQLKDFVNGEKKDPSFPGLKAFHLLLSITEGPHVNRTGKGLSYVSFNIWDGVRLCSTHLTQKLVDEHLQVLHCFFFNVQSRVDLLLDLRKQGRKEDEVEI